MSINQIVITYLKNKIAYLEMIFF